MFYMFIADGFEETEALATLDFMRRADISVKTVGVNGKSAVGSHGIEVKTDILIEDFDVTDADGVVLPGGMPGTLNLKASKTVKDAVLYCAATDKLVCAICAAPSVLGHLGVLEGRRATCFPGFESELTGAVVVDAPCVTDGKIITARGMGSVFDFSKDIITAVCGDKTAQGVLKQAQCR